MKALSIARKTLLELVREPLLLGLAFAFPILLILFYYVSFGETGQGLAKYLVLLVINDDAGVAIEGQPWQAGAQLVDALRQVEWEGKPVFDVSLVVDRPRAEIALRERKVALMLAIPTGFSQALLDAASGGPPATLSLVGDATSDNYLFAQSFLDDLVRQFARQAVGRDVVLPVQYEFVPGTGTMSDFDFGVPGVLVFGVMLLVVLAAEILVRENTSGTLRRLRLSRAGARDLLLGITLAQMLVALVQVPVTFGVAVACGFRGNGSLLLAMGIVLLLSLSAVGLGLITACFTRGESEAANLGAVLAMMMVLLSGALYPMPVAPLFTLAGHTVQIYDILPPAHATEALRRVLVLGDGLAAVAYHLITLAILSSILVLMGVVLYQRRRLRTV
jgi:ABC-2 type transport system permease protein